MNKIRDLFFIYKYSKFKISMRWFLGLIYDLLPICKLFALSALVNNGIHIFNRTLPPISIFKYVIIFGLVIMAEFIIRGSFSFFDGGILKNINSKFYMEFINTCTSLPYEYFEDKNTYNKIERIINNREFNLVKGYKNISNVFGIGVQLVSYFTVIFFKIWWLGLIFLVITAILIMFSIESGKSQYKMEKDITKKINFTKYIEDTLTNRNGNEERLVFDYTDSFLKKYTSFCLEWGKLAYKNIIKYMITIKTVNICIITTCFIFAGVLLLPLKNGIITVGFYIALVQMLIDFSYIVSWDLTDGILKISSYLEYVKDVKEIYSYKSIKEDKREICKNIDNIEIKDLSFRYRNNSEWILKNINLKLKKGKTYVLVGENGAGKTTLIKVLIGLYNEYKGEILFDNVDKKTYSNNSVLSCISTLFQDYGKFYFSVKENLLLGEKGNKVNKNKINEFLNCDNFIDNLKKGYDTLLGNIYEDGVDLSGGQWQKLNMLRCLISNRPILILDEPTSSLDPLAETNLYENFHKLSKNKTTLIISHRLGVCKIADEIILMDNGKIDCVGTFDDLLKYSIKFREMFESQKEWYSYE